MNSKRGDLTKVMFFFLIFNSNYFLRFFSLEFYDGGEIGTECFQNYFLLIAVI
jgi:hypothetical protein